MKLGPARTFTGSASVKDNDGDDVEGNDDDFDY